MTQITGIGFSNFRVFSKSTFFDLAPISIFTGTNSSGKSSVFKGILLLNDNADNLNRLDFTGSGHKLSTFQLAKSRYTECNTIRYIFAVENQNLLILDYIPSDTGNGEGGILNQIIITRNQKYKDIYDDDETIIRINHLEDGQSVEWFRNFEYLISKCLIDNEQRKERLLNEGDYALNSIEIGNQALKNWSGKIVSLEALSNILPDLEKKEVKWFSEIVEEDIIELFTTQICDKFEFESEINSPLKLRQYGEINIGATFIHDLKVKRKRKLFKLIEGLEIELSEVINQDFIIELQVFLYNYFDGLEEKVKNTLSNIGYLEAVRANSQRLYSNQSQGTAFNELLLGLDKIWSEDKSRENFVNISFADKWLKKFGIGDKVIINRVKGIATEVLIEKNGHNVDLIDLGYGVTQFLPILITIVSNYQKKDKYLSEELINENANGPLLLIEEPESNLHPRLQSLLADFFVDVVKHFEVTLLIETHSEYLIRRLQVLTADSKNEVKPEDSVIYYLDGNVTDDSDKFVRKINISLDGSLTNDFGPGFIDEATNWKMELMRLRNAQLHNLN
jgi:predicted ATP-dependent endonuclease of OLD family